MAEEPGISSGHARAPVLVMIFSLDSRARKASVVNDVELQELEAAMGQKPGHSRQGQEWLKGSSL